MTNNCFTGLSRLITAVAGLSVSHPGSVSHSGSRIWDTFKDTTLSVSQYEKELSKCSLFFAGPFQGIRQKNKQSSLDNRHPDENDRIIDVSLKVEN